METEGFNILRIAEIINTRGIIVDNVLIYRCTVHYINKIILSLKIYMAMEN